MAWFKDSSVTTLGMKDELVLGLIPPLWNTMKETLHMRIFNSEMCLAKVKVTRKGIFHDNTFLWMWNQLIQIEGM